jgi:hypothetical protein
MRFKTPDPFIPPLFLYSFRNVSEVLSALATSAVEMIIPAKYAKRMKQTKMEGGPDDQLIPSAIMQIHPKISSKPAIMLAIITHARLMAV